MGMGADKRPGRTSADRVPGGAGNAAEVRTSETRVPTANVPAANVPAANTADAAATAGGDGSDHAKPSRGSRLGCPCARGRCSPCGRTANRRSNGRSHATSNGPANECCSYATTNGRCPSEALWRGPGVHGEWCLICVCCRSLFFTLHSLQHIFAH